MGPSGSIVLFFVLLLVDMFFYGFGEAVQGLNLKEAEKKAQEGDKRSGRLLDIVNDPAEYVGTVQLVTTLVNIVMGGCILQIWYNMLRRMLSYAAENNLQLVLPAWVLAAVSTVIASFILIYILLTFGVLLPKRIAARKPDKWAYTCINPIFLITKLLSPLTGLVNGTVVLILKAFGIWEDEEGGDVTEEEIISMVNEGHEQGLIQASEAEMISNIFEYGDKEAQDIMTHRNNIDAIDGSILLEDAINYMLEGKNSRYPVYEENIDHIIGILYLKDAMRFHMDAKNEKLPVCELGGLLREASFVPGTKNIDELFKSMQSKKLQMVIVVDEYGQTDGLVTMEDILEEIVGNILDEYDEESSTIEEKGEDEYVIDGMTRLEDLEERFGISFEEEDFETLNGFLISKLDRIPEENESFSVDVGGYRFTILSVKNKMIASVHVKRLVTAAKKGSTQDT